jgi:hypothetical protein
MRPILFPKRGSKNTGNMVEAAKKKDKEEVIEVPQVPQVQEEETKVERKPLKRSHNIFGK